MDYQDADYAALYLDRLESILGSDTGSDDGYTLTQECARYLALGMAFQDTIRVADQKTRRARSERIRTEVKAGNDQFVYPVEFLHPRLEEVCDSLPRGLGEAVLASNWMKKVVGVFFGKGRHIQTGKLSG